MLDHTEQAVDRNHAEQAYGRNILLRTNGGDAFLIDAIALRHNSRTSKVWERKNGKAWCLSTEWKDAKKNWKRVVNGCYSSIEFNANGKAYVR